MITPGLLESQYDGSEKKKTTKRTLKITRIHRWENWGLSVDHTHIINQWSSQCSFLSEESTPISVGTLLPIFLNKCQFSKTHFSFFFFFLRLIFLDIMQIRERRLSGLLSREQEMKPVWGHTLPWDTL